MLGPTKISPLSTALFESLIDACNRTGQSSNDTVSLVSWLEENENKGEIELKEVVTWLKNTISLEGEAQFLLDSFRASLLRDLYHSLPKNADFNDDIEQPANNTLFEFLTVAGTIVAICSGFDGIASILGLFQFIPATLIFFAGIIFAALSVIVFWGFDLVTIAQNLGVDMDVPHAIDVFLDQVAQIEKIRALISSCCSEQSYEQDHIMLKQISEMLTLRYNELDDERNAYKKDLDAPYLKTAKSLTSAIAGVLFFGSGFFSGQAVFSAIASIFTTSALFWPTIVASFIVGIAAFSVYWFIERPGLETLVSRWLDIDEGKINALVADQVVREQKRELKQLAKQVEQLERCVDSSHSSLPMVRQWKFQAVPAPASHTSRFFNGRSHSVGDLSQLLTTEQELSPVRSSNS